MATLNSTQYDKARVTKPVQKLAQAELNGRKRVAYGDITFAGEVALNDVINMLVLPAGAVILDVRVIMPASGATGLFDVKADADLAIAISPKTGAVDVNMPWGAAAHRVKYADEVLVNLECTEATAASTGDKLEIEVEYVVD